MQLPKFSVEGMYRDPFVPMAYDMFPRHFLAAILERGYNGKSRAELAELLERGNWTSLLLQSPLGECPTGGRSAQHQWNEAQQCVAFEIWASRKRREGDTVAAQAFKRAARLSLESIRRWVRPSLELNIVKNAMDPAARHGFETYSFHSQYNLLVASMLATAWKFSDDKIPSGICPAEMGGFVVPVTPFHKLIANAGGHYLEIDTGADTNYNSSGLIRLHKAGVEGVVGPSDGTAIKNGALAVGIAWPQGHRWQSLAELDQTQIKRAQVFAKTATTNKVEFTIRYLIGLSNVQAVIENYELTPKSVRVTADVEGTVDRILVRFPALQFTGVRVARTEVSAAKTTVQLGKSRQTFVVESPPGVKLRRSGELQPTRNGFVEAIEGDVPGRRVIYTLTPEVLP